jgi:hypothetical protein
MLIYKRSQQYIKSHQAGGLLLSKALLLALAALGSLGLNVALRDNAGHGGRQLLLCARLGRLLARVCHPDHLIVAAVVVIVSVGRALVGALLVGILLLLLAILVPIARVKPVSNLTYYMGVFARIRVLFNGLSSASAKDLPVLIPDRATEHTRTDR